MAGLSFAIRALITAALITCTAAPLIAQGQTQDELHAVIRTQLMSDPRAAAMSQEQIDALVDSLAQTAQEDGITSGDIIWQPDAQPQFVAGERSAAAGCDASSFLCRLNAAFGFSGSDNTIAIWLGITSAFLILIIGTMIEVHHRKLHRAPPVQASTSTTVAKKS